jgi:transposase-like protein
MGTRSRVENEKRWRERVRRAEAYSGSLGAYCRTEGISPSSLWYWRRKASSKAALSVVAARPPAFVPVQVVHAPLECEDPESSLPDPRWVAEILAHLHRSAR